MVVVNIQSEESSTAQETNKGQASKPFLARKVTGVVKWFNVKSGYGFINRRDTGEDVFVHQSAIIKNNPKKSVRSVGDGEAVEFDVVAGEKGNEAANVTGPGGEAVIGSPYAAEKKRGLRQWFFRGGPRGPRKSEGEGNDGGAESGGGEDGAPRDDSKPRKYKNRRFVSGGYNAYPRRQNLSDKNGEKDGEVVTGDEEGRGGAPRGRGGRGGRRFRYMGYRVGGGRQSGPPKGRPHSGGDGGDSGKEADGGAERGGERGRGRGRGRPRYRRPNRSLSQSDKQAKSEEVTNDVKPEGASSNETSQAVQNTTDESAA